MRAWTQTRALSLLLLVLGGCGTEETCTVEQAGVMLSFDDYSPTWEEHLPLFARYDARVTFYPKGEWLLDESLSRADLLPLSLAGHSLGVHTLEHKRAPREYLRHKKRWLNEDVLAAKTILETALGQPVRSFAYPRGEHTGLTDRTLFEHFELLRGFRKEDRSYSEGELRQTPRFFFATSIDSRWERDDAYFRERLDQLAASRCEIWPIATHGIDQRTWGITPSRLEWLLTEIHDRGLRFYLPEDFLEGAAGRELAQ